jgi:hypothetical protein
MQPRKQSKTATTKAFLARPGIGGGGRSGSIGKRSLIVGGSEN